MRSERIVRELQERNALVVWAATLGRDVPDTPFSTILEAQAVATLLERAVAELVVEIEAHRALPCADDDNVVRPRLVPEALALVWDRKWRLVVPPNGSRWIFTWLSCAANAMPASVVTTVRIPTTRILNEWWSGGVRVKESAVGAN